jgi:exosortase family protein XrtG
MLLPILLFAVWITLLLVFKKVKIYFFFFLFGSIGMFGFLMYFGMSTVEKYLEYSVTYVIWIIGNLSGLYKAFPEYSMITSYHKVQAVSFFVDYECSGFIEMLVYVCLLMFYPVYHFWNKILFSIIGIIYIFICNVIRVFFICLITKLFGSGLFFFSHTIFARVLFFFFMVILYYVVFTKPHILKQRVGNMSYGK